jgi:hypothetical protein
MPRVVFEHTIPVFDWPKAVRDWDRSAIETGLLKDLERIYLITSILNRKLLQTKFSFISNNVMFLLMEQ